MQELADSSPWQWTGLCVLLPFHFCFSPHTASLGLCLGSSDQALTAGFQKLSKHLISSWPGIKLREERISVVNVQTHCSPDPLSWKDLQPSCREWVSQQMVSSCQLLWDANSHLSQGHALPKSILCWRLRWRYKGSAISPNPESMGKRFLLHGSVRLASQCTSPLAQCCFLILYFFDANSVSAFCTSNFTWVCLQRTDPGTLLRWATFRGPSQKYSAYSTPLRNTAILLLLLVTLGLHTCSLWSLYRLYTTRPLTFKNILTFYIFLSFLSVITYFPQIYYKHHSIWLLAQEKPSFWNSETFSINLFSSPGLWKGSLKLKIENWCLCSLCMTVASLPWGNELRLP